MSPTDKKGRGDHIIPSNLYGSICVKDVCIRCNNLLGQSADHLALEDARIISAVFDLELPDLQASIRDRGTGKSIDATDGSEIPVRFKHGKPKVVPKWMSKELFVCDEADAHKHMLNLLRKEKEHGLSMQQVEDILRNDVAPQYNRLSPGESVEEPRLGLRVRKAPCRIEQEWKVTEGACERLVAKIGYEIAYMAFEKERLLALTDLDTLKSVAMGEGRLPTTVLMYPLERYSPINSPPHGPKYYHQIIVLYEDYANIIDIYFFGCVGFRLLLSGDSPAAYGPYSGLNGDLDMMSFVMTFKPGASKTKYFFYRRAGQEKVEQKRFP